ncbi:MAG: hypothetical protein ACE10C_07415 [Candidatus Binatia bacterium]
MEYRLDLGMISATGKLFHGVDYRVDRAVIFAIGKLFHGVERG